MAKKKLEPKGCHGDCYYSVPNMNNLSVSTGEPILGSCKYNSHCFLLSEKTFCKNFKKNN